MLTLDEREIQTTTYKGYTIKTVGISQYIYRPGQIVPQRKAPPSTTLVTVAGTDLVSIGYAPGYAQSMVAAKRWINEDIKKQTAVPQDEGSLGRYRSKLKSLKG